MKTPHKHAELIKAWADGAEIECRFNKDDNWDPVNPPNWDHKYEYRIKPEPKPDIVRYRYVYEDALIGLRVSTDQTVSNLKLTFDGETNKLKSAKVIS